MKWAKLIPMILFVFILSSVVFAADWANESFPYRQQINVTETSGSDLNNFTALIQIDYLDNMLPDFSDLIFFDNDSVRANHWIENYTSGDHANIWVMIPETLIASSTEDIYVYYGNFDETDNEDPDNAFWGFYLNETTYTSSGTNNYKEVFNKSITLYGDWEYKLLNFSFYGNSANSPYDRLLIEGDTASIDFGNIGCENGSYSWFGPDCRYLGTGGSPNLRNINPPNSDFSNGVHNWLFQERIGITYTNYIYYSLVILGGYTSSEPTSTFGAEESNPSIGLTLDTSPVQNFNLTVFDLALSCEAGDNNGVTNLSLFINDSLVSNVLNSSLGENLSLSYTEIYPNSSVDWYCKAEDDEGNNLFSQLKTALISREGDYTQLANSTIIETTDNQFSLNLTNDGVGKEFTATLYFDGVPYTPTSRLVTEDYTYLTRSLIAEEVDTSTNFSWYWEVEWNLNGTYSSETNEFVGGATYSHNTTIQNQTITPISFTNCSTGNVAINFTFFDENDFSRISASSFEALFEVTTSLGSSDFSSKNFSLTNVSHASFCIGENESYYVSAEVNYRTDLYDARNYYLTNAFINNNTQNIKLYQLEITLGSPIKVIVEDNTGDPQENVYGFIQRKLLSTDSYETVGMIRTNNDGEDFVYLRKGDAFAKYRFVIFDEDNTVLQTTESFSIQDDSITITIAPETIGELFDLLDGISRSLVYNRNTQQVVGTWADPSGRVVETTLTVRQYNNGAENWICQIDSTSASGTLFCDVNESEGDIYAHLSNQINPKDEGLSLYFELPSAFSTALGETGVFVTIILLIFLGLLGAVIVNIPAGIIIFNLGLIITKVLEFHSIDWPTIVGVVGVGFIIMYLMRDKRDV